MAWYDDRGKSSHVTVYEKEDDFRKEFERAAQKGWEIVSSTGISGHINARRTAARVMTGGFLLGGASRSKDKITVSWRRPRFWVQAEDALSALRDLQSERERRDKRHGELGEAFEMVTLALGKLPTHAELERVDPEKRLEKDISRLKDRTGDLRKSTAQLTKKIQKAVDRYRKAEQAGASLEISSSDLMAELEQEASVQEGLKGRFERIDRLYEAQKVVVRASEACRDALRDEQKRASRLADTEKKLTGQIAQANSAPDDEKQAKRVRKSQDELERRTEEHQSSVAVREQAALQLDAVLSNRDEAVSDLLSQVN